MANMRLALNVLISNDPDLAQTLLREKASMAAAEHESYVRHLERLRSGKRQAVESSNIHLETVRALKTINSLLASVAYPVLRGDGETGVPHVEKA